MKPLTKNNLTRFWNHVEQIPFHECWEWAGMRNAHGYGIVTIHKRRERAHRVSLFLHGETMMSGLVVDHMCRNRGCVNPRHLRQVTRKVNTLENSESITAKYAARTHCECGKQFLRPKEAGWNVARICADCVKRRTKAYYDNNKEKIAKRRSRQK